MPELDGFAVLRAYGAEHLPLVIFVTAHDEFAVRAFDAHAIDYVVKPLREARFAEAVERARQRLRSDDAVALSRQLAAFLAGIEQRAGTGAHARRADHRADVERPVDARRGRDRLDRGGRLLRGDPCARAGGISFGNRCRRSPRDWTPRGSFASIAARSCSLDRVRELRAESSGETVAVLRDGTRVPVSRRRREQLAAALRSLAR